MVKKAFRKRHRKKRVKRSGGMTKLTNAVMGVTTFNKRPKIYKYNYPITSSLAVANVAGFSQGSQVLSLAQITANSSLAQIYQKYRIRKCTSTIRFNDVFTSSNQEPNFYVAPCYNYNMFNSASYTANKLSALPGCKLLVVSNEHRVVTVTWTPKPSLEIYGSTTAFNQYAVPSNKLWVDCSYPNALYYGLVWFCDFSASTGVIANITHDIEIEFSGLMDSF